MKICPAISSLLKTQMKKWQRITAALLAIAALAAASALSTAQTAQAQTITLGIEAHVGRLDPHASTSWNTFRVILHMYEGFVAEDLTRDDVDTPPLVPALAESWEASEDGTVYTFYLREGVKFHDGTPWNAEAAAFNLRRMTDPDFEYHQPVAQGLMSWMWEDLDSFEVVDEHTFRITLKNPNAEFLRRLAAGGTRPT
jgi:peptide/nickel transport system substrate-binding protein